MQGCDDWQAPPRLKRLAREYGADRMRYCVVNVQQIEVLFFCHRRHFGCERERVRLMLEQRVRHHFHFVETHAFAQLGQTGWECGSDEVNGVSAFGEFFAKFRADNAATAVARVYRDADVQLFGLWSFVIDLLIQPPKNNRRGFQRPKTQGHRRPKIVEAGDPRYRLPLSQLDSPSERGASEGGSIFLLLIFSNDSCNAPGGFLLERFSAAITANLDRTPRTASTRQKRYNVPVNRGSFRMPKISDIEETPNPNAVKFVLREPVSNGVARQYGSSELAQGDPLAKSLFDVGHVVSVFYMDNMITVEKDEESDWDELLPVLAVPIRAADAVSGGAAAAAAAAVGGPIAALTSDDPRLLQINEILDEKVRPALMGDGGYLEIMGLKENTLSIRYQGACGSCPSSLTGTLMAIESMLKQEVDPELEVVAV